jgi:hypothetical protein
MEGINKSVQLNMTHSPTNSNTTRESCEWDLQNYCVQCANSVQKRWQAVIKVNIYVLLVCMVLMFVVYKMEQ